MQNKNKSKKTTRVLNILILAALVAGLAWVASRFIHPGVEYTNNAQVKQHITPLNARVQGFVQEVRFNEFQPVKKGDTLVENGSKWVTANYKETRAARISEGQAVKITVDAVPGVTFRGVVRSISEATGSAYSLIPTENAAGNFVKVEQRIPVHIEFTNDNRPEDLARLRGGMNTICKVMYR